jgi:glycosylphosphatidylinositol transamidase (GPIT) subunit GPI8
MMNTRQIYLFTVALAVLVQLAACTESDSSTWAVIVCTSRYWFNYRHFANALAIYKEVRALGVPDEHIVLMSSLDAAMDPRNPFPGEMYSTNSAKDMLAGRDFFWNSSSGSSTHTPLSSSSSDGTADYHNFHQLGDVQVDYSGPACNTDSFLRLLTGRHLPGTPLRQRLRSGPQSKVLLYLTGHGGDEFLKFHDQEELSAADLAIALRQMRLQKRYQELLLIVDTCQASTLGNYLEDAPAVTFISSSGLGENSFAYDTNHELGLAVADRFTYKLQQYLQRHREVHKAYLLAQAQRARDPTPLHSATPPQSAQFTGSEKSLLKKARKNAMREAGAAGVPPSVQDLTDYLRQASQRRFLHSTASLQQSSGSRRAKNMVLAEFFGHAAAPRRGNIDESGQEPGGELGEHVERCAAETDAQEQDQEALWEQVFALPAVTFDDDYAFEVPTARSN